MVSHPSDKNNDVARVGHPGLVAGPQYESSPRSGVGEEEFPRGVEVEPALSAEPTGGEAGDVKKRVAAHAHHLGAVPTQEGSRGEANPGGMGDAAQADRATLALIGEGPAESEQADGEAPRELREFGERRIGGGVPIGEVEGGKVSDGRHEQELRGQECPADQRSACGRGDGSCSSIRPG